ncbi:MAG TPA: DUF1501 domain-containing protein [Pyrinomonadaceae bacterium]|nr:DUF1501 domain-containing protein [Pyrinomonadaceae bacterium]
MNDSRRDFLKTTACGLTGAALVASLGKFSLVDAMVQQQPEVASDYKALVCIFLNGGSDCNNMVIPYDDYNNPTGGSTNGYDNVRSASQLSIPKLALANTKITPSNTSGVSYAFHPNLSPEFGTVPGQAKGIMDIWNAGKLAVLCNVGSLVRPITRANYIANIGRPYQLFSHSDQVSQHMTCISNTAGQTGWAGRIADKTNSLNGPVALPMNISLAGTNLFSTGITSRQLAIAAAPTTLANLLVLSWNGVSGANPNTATSSFRALLNLDQDPMLVKASSDTTKQALSADQSLNQPDPVIPTPPNTTAFPNTGLGNQLKQIAKLIKIRDAAGITMKRQIFFCSIGGFDTHTNETGSDPANPGGQGSQSGTQGALMTQLGQAMKAFYDEMVAQGLSNNVTTFTLSDFGRTLQPSGSGAGTVGTDHAWGSHAFIMGGSVMGGQFYGSVRPDGTGLPFGYPALQLGGPDDTNSNRGQWIPTTAIDQYAATLARWYGLADTDRAAVFPNLFRFSTPNLGFLA